MIQVTGEAKGHIDEKRFYLPGVSLRGECPKCREVFVKDFDSDHFSYPVMNEKMTHGLWCGACNHEWRVTLELRVSLEIRQ